MKPAETIHDRIASDLPLNARVVAAIVDDPYSTTGEKITVIRSVRNDPLADMLSRNVIDKSQHEAGRKWQFLYERSTIGSIKAIDPTKEAVDGGKLPEPLTDSQKKAFRELNEAHTLLGRWGQALMHDLLAHHMTAGQIADKYGCATARQVNFMSLRLRECLEDLARMWGFA